MQHIPYHRFVYAAAALLIVGALAACGARPAAEQIVGRWAETRDPGHAIEFFADGSYIEDSSSGHRQRGTYALAADSGQISLDSSGTVTALALGFDGDMLLLSDTSFRRAEGDSAAESLTTLAVAQAPVVTSTPRPRPKIEPSSAALPTSAPPTSAPPTSAPTLILPTSSPVQVAASIATLQPPPAASIAPIGPVELHFRTTDPDDHYVAVRAQPTTHSSEVVRLGPGVELVCSGTLRGEALEYLGRRTDTWASCPQVGGYIFLALLIPSNPAP